MRRLDDVDEALVRRINSMLWLGRYHRRSIGYYRDAGMALQELRADRSKEMWADIITEPKAAHSKSCARRRLRQSGSIVNPSGYPKKHPH
jgi:hypothetical protein